MNVGDEEETVVTIYIYFLSSRFRHMIMYFGLNFLLSLYEVYDIYF